MERKTMGAFIAVLRKSSGMTQKELAEKLGVSDKTISHWERDESAPDISVIPVIAEIFGVTCDELLRGEKKSLSEPSNNFELSQKSEKQIHFILSKQSSRYLIQCLLCAGNSALGLAVAFLLYWEKAFSLFAVSLVFNIVSVLLLVIFSILNKSKLSSYEIDEKYLKPCKHKMQKALLLSAIFIVGAVAISLLFEIGYIGLIFLPVVLVALSFIGTLGSERLRKMTILTLATAVSLAIILTGSYQIILFAESTNTKTIEEMTFENIYAFKKFMETETDYPDYEYQVPDPEFLKYPHFHIENGHCEIEGDVIPTVPEDEVKINIHNDWHEKNFSISIKWNNLEVADAEVYMTEPTDSSEVRCVIYHYENIKTQQAYEHAVWVDFATIITAAVIVYVMIARKIFKKAKANKK